MAPHIPDETVAEIRQSLDIVDIISEYMQLKKQGKHYTGLCPFHGEKTPSFSVTPDKQLYHCFGCGAGGNVFTFVMEMESITFVEAASTLAKKAGIAVPEIGYSNAGKTRSSSENRQKEGHHLAARFYHHLLINTEQGKAAYDYLIARGFSHDMLERFQLGFSPDQPQVMKGLLDKRGYNLEEMEEAGLLLRQESNWELKDRFVNRIMFPIHDVQGQVIGFGGRVLGDGEPKYLNSPETPVFKKNETLYGLHLARQHIRKRNEAVLFEGYADVIAAANAGILNAIGSLGTSLTERQAKIIRRHTERVILCFDGDNAGQQAARKAADILEQQGLTVYVALLPDQLDPDDYLKTYGADQFKTEIIDGAFPLMTFKMRFLKRGRNLQDEGEKLQYIEEVLKEVTNLPKAIERDVYLRQLAEEFSLSFDALKQEQFRIYKESERDYKKRRNQSQQSDMRKRWGLESYQNKRLLPAYENAERILLHHMMRNADVCEMVQEKVGGDFNVDSHIAIAAHLYAYYTKGYESDPSQFINQLQDADLIQKASEIAMLDINRQLSENELADYIQQIKNYPKWVEIEEIEQKMKEAEKKHDYQLAVKLATEIVDMKKALKK
ncbi:DNA primase [Alteribacillus persepolensis]|uniref:DNA primase n=1 Tax=Alteribacillus persepolensis TaxID=568899 RepID=A0A1G8CSF6_9BACI|nr:DNA primase [Alteribacillus persepolensis]SDH48264.1 DNA primase [Alteribacillus persepolensis]